MQPWVVALMSAHYTVHIAGPFTDEETMTLPELEKLRESCDSQELDYLLKPMDIAVADSMAVELSEIVARIFPTGSGSNVDTGLSQWARRRYSARLSRGRHFLGVGTVNRRR